MKIYLIRHGETTSDVEDRYGGDYDDHLTEKGKRQVRKLAEKLASSGIDVIFASSKIRAQETAKILNDKLGVEIKTAEDLRERNLYGPLTGMQKKEAKQKFPELVERLKNTQDTIDGAENWQDFVKRVVTAFKKIAGSNYETVAVVTHGGPIRRIFGELLGIKKEMGEMKIDDCAYAVIKVKKGRFELIGNYGIYFSI